MPGFGQQQLPAAGSIPTAGRLENHYCVRVYFAVFRPGQPGVEGVAATATRKIRGAMEDIYFVPAYDRSASHQLVTGGYWSLLSAVYIRTARESCLTLLMQLMLCACCWRSPAPAAASPQKWGAGAGKPPTQLLPPARSRFRPGALAFSNLAHGDDARISPINAAAPQVNRPKIPKTSEAMARPLVLAGPGEATAGKRVARLLSRLGRDGVEIRGSPGGGRILRRLPPSWRDCSLSRLLVSMCGCHLLCYEIVLFLIPANGL